MKTYLNALGIVSALGVGCKESISALMNPNPQTLRTTDQFSPGVSLSLGQVMCDLPSLDGIDVDHRSRNNRLLALALGQIAPSINAVRERYGARRIGVVLGTSTSGIAEAEVGYKEFSQSGSWPLDFRYAQQDIGSPSRFAADFLGLMGPTYSVSTACSSSAKALATARRLLQLGVCDAVVAGGVDSLCNLTVQGFAALDALSRGRCNPMSKNRDGINIGEAAAVFVVTGSPATVELSGVGESSDAYHISAPDPTGVGAMKAMRDALRMAGREAGDVDYLNLHGTATAQNDAMESKVVYELFSEQVLCSSTKPLTGHCLGAAGALEAAICWLLLQSDHCNVLPVHCFDGEVDPVLSPIALVDVDNRQLPHVERVMSNSFAFGGSNVSLLFEKSEEFAK